MFPDRRRGHHWPGDLCAARVSRRQAESKRKEMVQWNWTKKWHRGQFWAAMGKDVCSVVSGVEGKSQERDVKSQMSAGNLENKREGARVGHTQIEGQVGARECGFCALVPHPDTKCTQAGGSRWWYVWPAGGI